MQIVGVHAVEGSLLVVAGHAPVTLDGPPALSLSPPPPDNTGDVYRLWDGRAVWRQLLPALR